ncbi:hypothetical protein BDR04DRAFT_1121859 [Suillus decipiens]|nr:hypothetical protein BDR04DRAFT_1121859 [Suillus decipiens]
MARKITRKKPADIIATEKKPVPNVPITNPKSKESRVHSKLCGMKAALSLLTKEPLKGKNNVHNSSDDEFEELISAVQHIGVKASENIPAKLNVTNWDKLQGSSERYSRVAMRAQTKTVKKDMGEMMWEICVACKELEIYLEIMKCYWSEVLLQQALTFGWPTVINFKLIPPHMKVLEGEIEHLLMSSDAKEDCYVFNLLSGNLIAKKKFGTNHKQAFDSFSKHKNFKITAPQLLLDIA